MAGRVLIPCLGGIYGQVLEKGEHTGARPGKVVRGPGWKGK